MALRASKWRVLVLSSKWDRCYVPIYEASARGRPARLLKTLMTNACGNECLYCPFRAFSAKEKMAWRPEKLAWAALELWKRGRINGVFLSSSIPADPDKVMELELETARLLRARGFMGYVHLRIMPGVSKELVEEAAGLADRMGVNLEAPSQDIFAEICPDKGSFMSDIIKRMRWAKEAMEKARQRDLRGPGSCRAGLDTQLVVGALNDNDLDFLFTTEWLYHELGLRRVYFSGFEPIPGTPLASRPACSRKRVLRLYQASFLLRDYGVRADELAELVGPDGLLPDRDPKLALAELQAWRFPLDPNTADFHELVRVPGIGPSAARTILSEREAGKEIKDFWDLVHILGFEKASLAARYLDIKRRGLGAWHQAK